MGAAAVNELQQLLSLEAKCSFELRVHLGRDLPDSDVRSALASGDMGFLHSFTTGATVDACARTLKRAGAARVDVLALALVTSEALAAA